MKRRLILILKALKINGRDAVGFTLSLLLAFSIWLIHNLSQNYTEIVRVYVTAKSNIEGHSNMSTSPVPISAKCRTRGFDIISLNRSSINRPKIIEINPSDLHHRVGDAFYITSSELNKYIPQIFGNSASNTSILQDTLVLRFAFESHKKVAVQPVYHVSFESQYTNVSKLKIVPDSVVIYGEPRHLDKTDRVFTESFALDNLKSNAHGFAKIVPIKGIRLANDQVEYSMKVDRYVEMSTTVPIRVYNAPSNRNIIVYPSTAQVKFRCCFPININPKDAVKFYIDFNDFEKSLNGKCVVKSTKLPEGVYGYSIDPEIFDCVEKVR